MRGVSRHRARFPRYRAGCAAQPAPLEERSLPTNNATARNDGAPAPFDGAWLDRMYNNRALVPDFDAHLERWAHDSAQVRRTQPCVTDIPYGPGPGEQLDVFPAQPQSGAAAPVLVFVHGGYWRALDKSDHSFIAPAFTRQGICVVIPNYALCPAVTIPDITLQVVRAVAWTWAHAPRLGADPARIVVAGHSAGGHLAAMMLACRWKQHNATMPPAAVRAALSISGLYDLEPLMHTPFLQADLQLTSEQVRRASPARLPAPRQGRLYTVAGGDESAEFLRHNQLIAQAWGPARVPVCETLAGHNHFSVLETLVQPQQRLHQLATELVARA